MNSVFLVKSCGVLYSVCSTYEKACEIVNKLNPSPKNLVYVHRVLLDNLPMNIEASWCFSERINLL